MRLQVDNLGKVAITVEENYWSLEKDYDKLTIVEKEGVFGTFISRKPVPAGTVLTDRRYWIPFSSLKEEIVLQFNEIVNELRGLEVSVDEKEAEIYKAIASVVAGGVALKQSFGDSEEFGISQKVLTESRDDLQAQIDAIVDNAADEEDLTSVNVEGTDVLKFKDKVYNPLVYSGLGRKILRKNIVNGVNVLTQDMMPIAENEGEEDPGRNTIYIIQYDFTLGENINIPNNCVLEFDGGSLSNGSIVFDDTYLEGSICIKNNCTCTGTIANSKVNVNWFTSGPATTDYRAIQNAINVGNYVIFDEGEYTIGATDSVNLHSNMTIFFNKGAVLRKETEETITFYINMIQSINCSNVTIIGGEIIGDLEAHEEEITNLTSAIEYQCTAIYFKGGEHNEVRDCIIHHHIGDGIYIGSYNLPTNSTKVDNCLIYDCWRHGITSIGKHIHIKNTEIYGIYWLDAIDIESDDLSYTQCEDYTIENCYAHSPNTQSYSINRAFAFLKAKNCKLINSTATYPSQIASHYGDFLLDKYDGTFHILNSREIGNVLINNSQLELEVTTYARDVLVKNSTVNRFMSTYSGSDVLSNITFKNCTINIQEALDWYNASAPNSMNVIDCQIICGADGILELKSASGVVVKNCYIKANSDISNAAMITNGNKLICDNNIFDFLSVNATVGNGLIRLLNNICYFTNNTVCSNGAVGGVYGGNLLRLDYSSIETAYLYNNTAPKYNKLYYTDKQNQNIYTNNNIPENYSTSGTFASKPSSKLIYVGFRYFCIDKQTTEGATNGIEIIYKDQDTSDPENPVDVWVDALGRIVE